MERGEQTAQVIVYTYALYCSLAGTKDKVTCRD